MIYDVWYVGLEDRKRQVKAQETMGRRMLSDTFAEGMINAGTMIFTDNPASSAPPARDLEAELDILFAEVEILKGK